MHLFVCLLNVKWQERKQVTSRNNSEGMRSERQTNTQTLNLNLETVVAGMHDAICHFLTLNQQRRVAASQVDRVPNFEWSGSAPRPRATLRPFSIEHPATDLARLSHRHHLAASARRLLHPTYSSSSFNTSPRSASETTTSILCPHRRHHCYAPLRPHRHRCPPSKM